jgi:hypothetical protein
MLTFGSDIRVSASMILPVRCDGLLWASFPGVFGAGGQVWARGLRWRVGLLLVACRGVAGGYGPAVSWARGVRRRLRVRGGRPAAARRALSCWRVVAGGQDALVADCQQAGDPQGERGQAHESAPAAGDAGGGAVFDGGVEAFGGGAPPVGPPPLWRGVVVLLPGFGRDLGRDGDGLLGAAGGRVFWRGEDLGPVAAEGH